MLNAQGYPKDLPTLGVTVIDLFFSQFDSNPIHGGWMWLICLFFSKLDMVENS